jgi:serine/threonine protein kinase
MLPEIKLIDFGTAKKFEYHTFSEGYVNPTSYKYPIGLKEKVGTLNYMAPEILDPEANREKKPDGHTHHLKPDPTGQSYSEYKKHYYSEKVDVWSIGVIAYVLLTGKPLFNDNQNTKALMDEIKGFIDDPESQAWKDKNQKSVKEHYFKQKEFTR